MSINSNRQSQFELFPSPAENPATVHKSAFQLKGLTLSPENIILLFIVFIITMIFFFSFGVEKGKRIALKQIPFEQTAASSGITVRSKDIEPSQPIESQITDTSESVEGLKVNEEIYELPVEQEVIEKNFTIQVASFKLRKNADKEAMGLKQKGYDILVMSKGKYSIVCVGKFGGKNEAKQFANQLDRRYKDYLIRRL